jgi:hypothetical protein
LKELLKADAITEQQYKKRKSSLKRRDRGLGEEEEEEEEGREGEEKEEGRGGLGEGEGEGAGGGGVEDDDIGGEVGGVKVGGKGKKSMSTGGGGVGGGGGGGGGLVPLNQIVLAKEGSCNMDGSEDPHYRYKMPVLQVKVEGATKMIRTVLTNMPSVAAAVGRPMSYLVTYLGQECSAMSQIAKPDRDGPGAMPWLSGKHQLQTVTSFSSTNYYSSTSQVQSRG